MEVVLIGLIVAILVLQVLNLNKKVDVKNEGNEKIEAKLLELENKFINLSENLDLKLQNIISKEILNISEKISLGSSSTNETLAKNNENIGLKLSQLEGKVDQKLAETLQGNLKSAGELKNELAKVIADLRKETAETLGKTNESLKENFGVLENKIVKTLGDTNEKVIVKFSGLESNVIRTLNTSNENINEKLNETVKTSMKTSEELKNQLNKEINLFKDKLGENLDTKFNHLTTNVGQRLDKINERVEEKLKDGFEKTTKTFNSILERLSKIDEAQKKIDGLSTEIVSLQDVLTDKKSRGIFGEVQLNQILQSVLGENNDKSFAIQHTLKNGTIADAVLFAPEPVGTIAIDSKFPLENYKKMTDRELSESEKTEAGKAFKRDIKTHINAIASKYIIPGETSAQAIMFLPAEAIFAEINAYHADLVEYSQQNRVWVCSPTTLMAVLTTMQVVMQNAEREKYAHIIHEELTKLGTEFGRYKERWDKLAKHIETVNKDVKDIHTTTKKIGNRFDSISRAEFQESEVELRTELERLEA